MGRKYERIWAFLCRAVVRCVATQFILSQRVAHPVLNHVIQVDDAIRIGLSSRRSDPVVLNERGSCTKHGFGVALGGIICKDSQVDSKRHSEGV